MAAGVAHVRWLGVDVCGSGDDVNITCSWFRPSRPSTHVITIRLFASAPEGAPLAMSTDGAGDRSDRAPPTPSITQRPIEGSKALHVSYAVNSAWGRAHDLPPSV